MYQGEVDVSEEDLPSFLEAAEDLNIRGLTEANTESFNSSREFPSEPSHQEIAPSLKRKRNAENRQKVIVKDDNCFDGVEFEKQPINKDINISNIHSEVLTHNYNESVTQHIVSTTAEKQFQCQKCDKSFCRKSSLYNHNKSSHDEVKYMCPECNYEASQRGHLQQHVAAVHEGVKYPCTECSFKAQRNDKLQKHVATVHTMQL